MVPSPCGMTSRVLAFDSRRPEPRSFQRYRVHQWRTKGSQWNAKASLGPGKWWIGELTNQKWLMVPSRTWIIWIVPTIQGPHLAWLDLFQENIPPKSMFFTTKIRGFYHQDPANIVFSMFLSTNGSNRNIFWHDHTESWSSCSGFTCSFNIIQHHSTK